MSLNRKSLELYSCCFCPGMFCDKRKLDTHKESVHRVFSKDMLENFSSGRSTNFKIMIPNIGTRLEVECALCGHFGKLSEYKEHQAIHLWKKIESGIPLSVVSIAPTGRVPLTGVKNGTKKTRITNNATNTLTRPQPLTNGYKTNKKHAGYRQQFSGRAGADVPVKMRLEAEKTTRQTIVNVRPHNGRVTCLTCKASVNEAELINHIQTHISRGQLSCAICKRKYTTTTALRAHVNSSHYGIPKSRKVISVKRLFNCKSCPESFPNRSDKEHQELVHADTKPVVGNSKITRSKASKEKIEFEVLKEPVARARKKATKSKTVGFHCMFCRRGFHTKQECMDHENAPVDCSKPRSHQEMVFESTEVMDTEIDHNHPQG